MHAISNCHAHQTMQSQAKHAHKLLTTSNITAMPVACLACKAQHRTCIYQWYDRHLLSEPLTHVLSVQQTHSHHIKKLMGPLHQLSVVAYSFLPQAGDGGEYLEGYKDPYHVCFKCGKPGHWAQNCTGFLPDGQVSPLCFLAPPTSAPLMSPCAAPCASPSSSSLSHVLHFLFPFPVCAPLHSPLRFPSPARYPSPAPYPSSTPPPTHSPPPSCPCPCLCHCFTQSKIYCIAYACRQSQMAAAVMLRQPPWPPGQPLPSTPASVATCTCPETCPPLSRPPWQGLQMMYWQAV